MSILSEQQRSKIKSELAQKLVNPVTLTAFTQEFECAYCKEARLTAELATPNDKITIQVFDLLKYKEKA